MYKFRFFYFLIFEFFSSGQTICYMLFQELFSYKMKSIVGASFKVVAYVE